MIVGRPISGFLMRLCAGAEEAVQGVCRGEGAQHHKWVRRTAGDLLQLQEGPGISWSLQNTSVILNAKR